MDNIVQGLPYTTVYQEEYLIHMEKLISFFKISLNIYLCLIQREIEQGKGRGIEREGDTASEAGSRL